MTALSTLKAMTVFTIVQGFVRRRQQNHSTVRAFTVITAKYPKSQPLLSSSLWSSSSCSSSALALSSGGRNPRSMPPLPNSYSSSSSSTLPQRIETNGADILIFTHDIADNAIDQLKVLAESGIATGHVAAMPDAHLGNGVTVGTVFASDKYVSPNAVGVDIGCGMGAIKVPGLNKETMTNDMKNRIHQLLKERIPTGFSWYKEPLEETRQILDKIKGEVGPTRTLTDLLSTKKQYLKQLGTLGGGNHFLEVVHEEVSGDIWLMLHSGSRGIGNEIARYHDGVAKTLLEKSGVDTASLKGLHYMKIESPEGQDYLRDMEFCQRYAYHNRAFMQRRMVEVVEEITGKTADPDTAINIHHNYCVCETCADGRKLWITRKGATSAKKGELGIIPGSMGTGSYISRGLGNPSSWSSSSHGAGRKLSRGAAFKNISQKEFEHSMRGIVCDRGDNLRDEAPQAYKDLNVVMKNQEELTEIVHRLLPLINVKGADKPRRKQLPKEQQRRRLETEKKRILRTMENAKKKGNRNKLMRSEILLEQVEANIVGLDE